MRVKGFSRGAVRVAAQTPSKASSEPPSNVEDRRLAPASPSEQPATAPPPVDPTFHHAPGACRRPETIDLHYLEWGSRQDQPIILLHGNSAHAHWWDFVAPGLAANYRVIALDLRGHGESSWVAPPAYLIRDYVADLEQFVEIMNLDSPVLVGHSLGGFIALSFAIRNQVRLRAAVAVDAKPVIGDGNSDFVSRLRSFPHPRYADLDEAIRRFRPVPRGTRARPEVIAHVARFAVRRNPNGYWEPKFHREAFASHPYSDIRPRLASLACPLLLVRGRESTFVSRETVQQMAALCPDATAVEIGEAEHHVLLDQPQELSAVIHRFLERA